MSNIKQSYQIKNISLDSIYQESLQILKKLGSQDIKENLISPTNKELIATIPSIWGWGGVNISIRLEQTSNGILLVLNGYIAQIHTSPLTKQMDNFLQQLQTILKEKYNSSFEYEKLTQFFPKYKFSVNETEKKLFNRLMFLTFLTILLSIFILFKSSTSLLLIGIIILFGYKFRKKFIDKMFK